MKRLYFIVMNVGDRYRYVVTTDDVEDGGSVDANPPEDFGFTTEKEAEEAMNELIEYAESKGYVNAKFYIE